VALTANTSLFSAVSEIELITGEAQLVNLERGSLTVLGVAGEATNWLIREMRKRHGGKDPATVTNQQDLEHAAAYWIVATLFRADPAEGSPDKAVRYEILADSALESASFQFSSGEVRSGNRRRGPLVVNHDSGPAIGGGVDMRRTDTTQTYYYSRGS